MCFCSTQTSRWCHVPKWRRKTQPQQMPDLCSTICTENLTVCWLPCPTGRVNEALSIRTELGRSKCVGLTSSEDRWHNLATQSKAWNGKQQYVICYQMSGDKACSIRIAYNLIEVYSLDIFRIAWINNSEVVLTSERVRAFGARSVKKSLLGVPSMTVSLRDCRSESPASAIPTVLHLQDSTPHPSSAGLSRDQTFLGMYCYN